MRISTPAHRERLAPLCSIVVEQLLPPPDYPQLVGAHADHADLHHTEVRLALPNGRPAAAVPEGDAPISNLRGRGRRLARDTRGPHLACTGSGRHMLCWVGWGLQVPGGEACTVQGKHANGCPAQPAQPPAIASAGLLPPAQVGPIGPKVLPGLSELPCSAGDPSPLHTAHAAVGLVAAIPMTRGEACMRTVVKAFENTSVQEFAAES